MKSNQIFQIRFPNKDIKIRVKTLGSTTYWSIFYLSF
jgi:hypothetical protein